MSTREKFRILACSLAIVSSAFTARADILFASYDPSNASVTFPTRLTAFIVVPGGVETIYGAEFSPTLSGQLQSLTAGIAVGCETCFTGFPLISFSFDLFLQPVPGAMIDPFSATPIDTFSQMVQSGPLGGPIASITFASTDHPFLNSAETYWLYMGIGGRVLPHYWGVPSSTGLTGTVAEAIFDPNFPPGTTFSVSTSTLPGFVLNSVPEPTSLVLLATVAASVLGMLRRTRP